MSEENAGSIHQEMKQIMLGGKCFILYLPLRVLAVQTAANSLSATESETGHFTPQKATFVPVCILAVQVTAKANVCHRRRD